jgi:hypothetical protein
MTEMNNKKVTTKSKIKNSFRLRVKFSGSVLA